MLQPRKKTALATKNNSMSRTHILKPPALQDLTNHKSLIAKAFAKITPPVEAFEPEKPWSHSYQDLSTFNQSLQGGVTIAYTPEKKLRIESHRNCVNGYRYYTMAELICASDPFATPISWSVTSKVAKGSRKPDFLNSRLMKEASVSAGVLTLKTGHNQRQEKIAGAYTCKWALLHGIGQMARTGKKQIKFSLIDEYDEHCPNQMLRALKPEMVQSRKGLIKVLPYQHTGTATVPGTYYLDSWGRVLFYVAGMEFLALNGVNGKKVGYVK